MISLLMLSVTAVSAQYLWVNRVRGDVGEDVKLSGKKFGLLLFVVGPTERTLSEIDPLSILIIHFFLEQYQENASDIQANVSGFICVRLSQGFLESSLAQESFVGYLIDFSLSSTGGCFHRFGKGESSTPNIFNNPPLS